MNAYINDPMCMGKPAYMPSFMAEACSMFSDPTTGTPTGYSYKGQCIATSTSVTSLTKQPLSLSTSRPSSRPSCQPSLQPSSLPSLQPNMLFPPSSNSSPLPTMGYVVVSTFSTDTCMPGTLTASSGSLIGYCMVGICSGRNASCMASLTFVNEEAYNALSFSQSYVEFDSPECSMSSMIGSPESKWIGSTCSSGVKYTYYPMSTVPNSIVAMLMTNSPGGLAEL